jgi:hypothetical protein
VKVPGGFATLPATTTDTVVPTTVTVPPQTVTAPGATTLVTVPVGQTTTVTTPANTVTLPAQTVTVGGAVVTQPAETVTVPGETQTVTAAGTTTVLTVTAPNTRFVRGGVLAAKIRLAVQQHRRVVRLRARVLHITLRHLKRQKLIVIVVRRGCPDGTKLSSNGRCAPIVRGRG